MYIKAVSNRNSPPAILLRESYRRDGKVHKRTLCNLSDWPATHVEGLHGVLKGGTVIPAGQDAFTITRSLPHGHVAAALGTARKIGLDRILGPDGIGASKAATVRCAGSCAHDRLANSVAPTTSYVTFSVPAPEPISKCPPTTVGSTSFADRNSLECAGRRLKNLVLHRTSYTCWRER
jgi:hypothetical protein